MSGSAAAKIFKRQSGQFKAVVVEAQEVLEATRAVVDKMQSDPPPPVSITPPAPPTRPRSRFDAEEGRYSLIHTPATGFEVLIDAKGEPLKPANNK